VSGDLYRSFRNAETNLLILAAQAAILIEVAGALLRLKSSRIFRHCNFFLAPRLDDFFHLYRNAVLIWACSAE